ncbi:MAG TPA: hypothetical protein EYP22_03670 [Methanosarcinales archaeon]|nr:hypothetical protein [Methanosarcinales archaeon]
MNKPELLKIIKDIFTVYGYKASESNKSEFDVIAENEKEIIFIKYESIPKSTNIHALAKTVQDSNGIGLYISNKNIEDISDYARECARKNGIVLWSRSDLEKHIGRAALANIEKVPCEFKIQKPSKITKIKVQLHSIPLKVSKENALALAKPIIGDTNTVLLKFIPFWVYNYEFDTEYLYKSKKIKLSASGMGSINALNGVNTFTTYKEVQEQIEVPDNYEIKEPILAKDDALSSAINAITQKHKREIKFNETIGEAIIFEHKVFKPDSKEINLSIDLIYIPHWEVQGFSNSVNINAYDGNIMSIPIDDDAEFL